MEQVLNVYELPYNQKRPVICFDERPCQLISNILKPLAMEPGKAQREDYHYKRNGTCCVLMAVEPLIGNRIAKVTKQKTKKDYAFFMRELDQKYSNAEKIIKVSRQRWARKFDPSEYTSLITDEEIKQSFSKGGGGGYQGNKGGYNKPYEKKPYHKNDNNKSQKTHKPFAKAFTGLKDAFSEKSDSNRDKNRAKTHHSQEKNKPSNKGNVLFKSNDSK